MIETYSLKFPKLRTRTKLKFLTWLLILVAFIIAFLFKDTICWGVALLTLVVCGLWNQYLITSREDPEQYFYKAIRFDTDQIIISDTVYKINLMSTLKILINEFDGQKSATGRGARMILNGTDNELSFSYQNKTVCITFYINSETQKEQFKTLFDDWYKNKIEFYEGTIGGKTYLLQILNHQQIQEFKKNYELT